MARTVLKSFSIAAISQSSSSSSAEIRVFHRIEARHGYSAGGYDLDEESSTTKSPENKEEGSFNKSGKRHTSGPNG